MVSPADLTAQLPDRTVTARTALRDSELRALPDVLDVTVADGRMRAASARPEATVRALLAADPTLATCGSRAPRSSRPSSSMTAQESQEVAA